MHDKSVQVDVRSVLERSATGHTESVDALARTMTTSCLFRSIFPDLSTAMVEFDTSLSCFCIKISPLIPRMVL